MELRSDNLKCLRRRSAQSLPDTRMRQIKRVI